MLTLPNIGFKVLHAMGGQVMPHGLHNVITSYINDSGKLELGKNDSWCLVLDWLLCAPQAKGDRASILPASLP